MVLGKQTFSTKRKKTNPKKDKQEDLLWKGIILTNLKDRVSSADSCRYMEIILKELQCLLEG